MKRKFSGLRLEDAMRLIPAERLRTWEPAVSPRLPSDTLRDVLRRLHSFDLQSSELAKTLLIDALFVEIVPLHPQLKVWKAAPLETDTLSGIADYLISADRAYLAAPLLCVAEAKRDDFLLGQAQCVAEMHACRWNNERAGREHDLYGIVSNGQVWQFFKLTPEREVYGSDLYVTASLPALLGMLDYVCGECARNVS